MINILEYLENAAIKAGDKTAFYGTDGEQITFDQLLRRGQRIGCAISRVTDVREPVLVLTGKKISSIVMFLGVVYSGCYYIPMDVDLPMSRIKAILNVARPTLVIGEKDDIERFGAAEYQCNTLNYEDMLCGQTDVQILSLIREQACNVDPLYVIFTSGSTGLPKGVVTSHQSVIDYIDAFCSVAQITEEDILGNQAPLDYVAAIRDIYIPLKTGASMVLIDQKLFSIPARLFEYLNANKVTTLCWVAPAFNIPVTYHAFEKYQLSSVNKIIFTGSVMSSKTLAVWQKYLPDALYMNHYGPTEITASCTYHIIDHPVSQDEILPIGKPFCNTQILLITEEGRPAAPGEKGEIYVGGCCLALGYMNAPELTEKSFVNNPLNTAFPQRVYKTGDIGYFDQNGVLWFCGRNDSQIKHMGHRVELGEIEDTVRSLDGIVDCSCAYHEEKENIYLFYEGTLTAKELAIVLRERLPGFMVPRRFVRFDALPRLENGKIDRKLLKGYFK